MITRRTMLRTTATAGALAFAANMPGLQALAQGTVPLRRSVGELALNDPIIETYREFVAKMKEKPSNQPASWIGFSDVHGTASGGFNLCPHGNWYFLPWHRAYLQMYEIMARDTTGNQDFAMPYWDWTADRQIPKAFSDPTLTNGDPNPLFDSSRTMPANASLPDHVVGQSQVMDGIFSETNFETFATTRPAGQNNLDPSWITGGGGSQGAMEGNPHNQVHCRVGGDMCSAISPQDPIFMMHHCNIDRIWAAWNALGRTNTTDPLWLDMPFTDNFIAPDGSLYTKVVKDLQQTEPLGYTYTPPPPDPIPVDPDVNNKYIALYGGASAALAAGAGPLRVTADNSAMAEALKPLSVALGVDPKAIAKAVAVQTPSLAASSNEPSPQVLALIKDIKTNNTMVTEYRVFVNCDYLSQAVPTTDPHYVTTFGFFGDHKAGSGSSHKKDPSVVVNLTDTLKALSRQKRLVNDKVTVQILPVPYPGVPLEKAGTAVPAMVEIAVI
ncbi:tyrosinase family protein [Anderseniella sp. Alg231-50]|uniref:tyrosinase family protein n=1 Tax=Anderseniella sp. Alg231-50 TaxID=1922226 RepID=UPI000D54E117